MPKPSECFAYDGKEEIVELYDGRRVKTTREMCRILRHMDCRKHADAKKACRFFKTRAEYEAGRKRYGGEKKEVQERK